METDRSTKGADLYAKALNLMPGGVSRNTVLRKPSEMLVPTSVWIRVVSVDRRDNTSPLFSVSKNAGSWRSTLPYTSMRRS